MSQAIHWPDGNFTIQQAADLNPSIPQADVRKKLADAIAAKTVVQTKKGDHKVKGQFQVVKPAASS